MEELLNAVRDATEKWAQRHETCDAKHVQLEDELAKAHTTIEELSARLAELVPERDQLRSQIDQLATFIIEKVEGEPSQSQGAVDTAIRIIQETQRVLQFADGLAVKETGEPLANLYAKDAPAQRVLTAAGCHPRDNTP